MACIYGVEQNCSECRMCTEKKEYEKVKVTEAEIVEQKQTNADWIRNMSNEELAIFLLKLTNFPDCFLIDEDCKKFPNIPDDISCKDCFKEWLESERD